MNLIEIQEKYPKYTPIKINCNFKDMTNTKIGELKILYRTNDQNKRVMWVTKCFCGNYFVADGGNLRSGNTTSCGCGKILAGMRNLKDMRGKKFGKLTVLELCPERANDGQAKWKCLCDCGQIAYVSGGHLRTGHTTSCGCNNSKGELYIRQILDELGISYVYQYAPKSALSSLGGRFKFDFAIVHKNSGKGVFIIEYDGRQHFYAAGEDWNTEEVFEDTKRRDKEKEEYCKQKNILVLHIPYWKDTKEKIKNSIVEFISQNNIDLGL